MYPIQPYFALSTSRYYKRPFAAEGIAHIYAYTAEQTAGGFLVVVPDGCIDLLIDEDAPGRLAYAAGSVLQGTRIPLTEGHRYFGVRFLPGAMPSFLDGALPDFLGQSIALPLCSPQAGALLDGILSARSFPEKADFFLRFYAANGQASMHPDGTGTLARYVWDAIAAHHGLLRIGELAQETGYSDRYLRRVFKEATGMTPKCFCRISRFQHAIDHLDHDNEIAMTDLAADHGDYDQAQFIREFREFTLLAPRRYRQALLASDYTQKFILA